MKKTTKLLKAVTLCVMATLLVYACSDVFSIDFTKKESVGKIKERLEKEIPSDADIIGISFSAIPDFTSKMEIAVVYYYPAGGELTGKNVPLGKGDSRESRPTLDMKEIKAENGLKLADIDFSVISDYVQKGIDIMSSDSINMPYSGIGSYEIKIDKKTLKLFHKFSLDSKGDSKTTTKGGRLATETEYYRFDFKSTPEGEVILVE